METTIINIKMINENKGWFEKMDSLLDTSNI